MLAASLDMVRYAERWQGGEWMERQGKAREEKREDMNYHIASSSRLMMAV
jgi:hypothetical protein